LLGIVGIARRRLSV